MDAAEAEILSLFILCIIIPLTKPGEYTTHNARDDNWVGDLRCVMLQLP